jgi:eukaryotic-like serine/threonine-protein kinase
MDVERRRRIEDLFDLALDRPPGERTAWVAGAADGDAALAAEVEALLEAHALAERAFDGAASPPVPERHIGAYRLVRELGRGGMGVVYLAERDDGQFRRRVAVKLLRTGPDAGELHRRFLAERQILASLDHPHIAQLLDGGVTDGDLPYLVMEYVDGVPITTYCDRHGLDLPARLRLFQDVCAAVHHAHKNLVLHRDLKPGNVLVTPAGQVKLLDFGIAKLLNPGLGGMDQPLTRTEFRVMTPEYASPEQVRGESLTTTSDVYALGVLLYELLTGRRPHGGGGSPVPGGRRAGDREPERPSTAVLRAPVTGDGAGSRATVASLAAARDASPERLRRLLRGDGDAITMMALRVEPGRRYGSAELLAQDVQRWLEGLPVLAHRGSRAYRVRKLLRRHRGAAVAGVLVAASLLGGTAVAARQAAEARREQARAEHAQRQAEVVTEFLMGLFDASDPGAARGDTVTAAELLERGVTRAEALAEAPEVQAEMFSVVGRVHRSLGRYEEAQRLLERALRIRAGAGGWRAETAPLLTDYADVLRRRGEYDSAQAVLERVAALQRGAAGGDDVGVAATLHDLSRVALARGDLAGAEARAREVVAIRQRLLGESDPRTLAGLASLGAVLRERADYAGAERMLRQAVRLRQAGGGAATPEGAADALVLAELLLLDLRQPAEAEALYRQALVALRAAPRPDEDQLVRALGGLARALETRGAAGESEALLVEALELRRRTYGAEHPHVSTALSHLAGAVERGGDLARAEGLFREAAAMEGRLLGETHPGRAGTLTALARVLTARGRLREADGVLQEASAIRVARLGADHPLVARTLRRQAEVRMRLRDYPAAEGLLLRAREIEVAQASGESHFLAELHGLLVALYEGWGRPEAAAPYRAEGR